ncbi:MAG TPA: hypothetical protein VMW72_24490 [Sedimentisphaerales bacterium]|nr:hypothetical protein [Sedimentisphaerales bacterium]
MQVRTHQRCQRGRPLEKIVVAGRRDQLGTTNLANTQAGIVGDSVDTQNFAQATLFDVLGEGQQSYVRAVL